MRITGWLCFCLLLFSGFATLNAATVVLNNGDRVSGNIVSRDGTQVVLESRLFGRLEIAISEIDEIEPDAPAPVVATPVAPEEKEQTAESADAPEAPAVEEEAPETEKVAAAKETKPKDQGPVELTAEEVARSLEETRELKAVVRNLLQTPIIGSLVEFLKGLHVLKEWDTKFDLSLTFVQGQADSQAMGIFFVSARKWGKQDVRLTSSYEYGTTKESNGNEAVSLDRTRAGVRYRYDLTKRLFLQSNSAYMQDHVKGIDLQIDESLGIGWRFLDSQSWEGSITPSITFQYQDLAGSNTSDKTVDGWNLGPSISQELMFRMNDHITFRQEAWVRVPESDFDLMSYMWSIRMETKVLDNITFNTGYELTYDGFVTDDRVKSQHTIKTSVGIAF